MSAIAAVSAPSSDQKTNAPIGLPTNPQGELEGRIAKLEKELARTQKELAVERAFRKASDVLREYRSIVDCNNPTQALIDKYIVQLKESIDTISDNGTQEETNTLKSAHTHLSKIRKNFSKEENIRSEQAPVQPPKGDDKTAALNSADDGDRPLLSKKSIAALATGIAGIAYYIFF